MTEISWDQFDIVELRSGTIIAAELFPEARKPAYKITVDFGELGEKRTSAQITDLYSVDELVGRQVVGVVNFAKKQIGPFMSEFLLTGFIQDDGAVVLAIPERPIDNGLKLG